jgi:hypothetical protein
MDNRDWFFAKGDKRFGPMGLGDLQQRIATGEVERSDLVWAQGDPDWRVAGDVPDLFAGGASSAPPPPPRRAQSTGHAPWPAPPESAYAEATGRSTPVPSYLWQSIVITLLCCNPLAIVAIVYAAKVDGLVARGQFAAARRASDVAKTWCIVSVVITIGLSLVWTIFSTVPHRIR